MRLRPDSQELCATETPVEIRWNGEIGDGSARGRLCMVLTGRELSSVTPLRSRLVAYFKTNRRINSQWHCVRSQAQMQKEWGAYAPLPNSSGAMGPRARGGGGLGRREQTRLRRYMAIHGAAGPPASRGRHGGQPAGPRAFQNRWDGGGKGGRLGGGRASGRRRRGGGRAGRGCTRGPGSTPSPEGLWGTGSTMEKSCGHNGSYR